MYTDNWHSEGLKYTAEYKTDLNDAVTMHCYYAEDDGRMLGVGLKFNYADDYHYELLPNDWNNWVKTLFNCDDFEQGLDPVKKFFMAHNTDSVADKFAFQDSLVEHNIPYQKIAFYDFDDCFM